MKTLIYKEKTADVSDIYQHLNDCSKYHIPALDVRVNIKDYAKKLIDYSQTFECWEDKVLVGLLSIYCNNNKHNSGFITNLSVLPTHYKRTIASSLLKSCIEYAKKLKLAEIKLEVHGDNIAAVHLYKKYGFYEYQKHSIKLNIQKNIFMKKILNF